MAQTAAERRLHRRDRMFLAYRCKTFVRDGFRFCTVFWKVSDIISRMLSFYFFKQIRPDALFIRIAAVYCNEYWMYLMTALLVIFMVPSCCGSIVRY